MKNARLGITVALALAAGVAGAAYEYGGEWATADLCYGLDVNAVTGDVYTLVRYDVTRYTSEGSLLGSWDAGPIMCMPFDVACSPVGYVYATNVCQGDADYIRYCTSSGSFLGQFVHFSWREAYAVDFAPDGTFYGTDDGNSVIWHCAAAGKVLSTWGDDFLAPKRVGVAPNGTVYVADTGHNILKYYSASGSFIGSWGGYGAKDGQFRQPWGVAVAAGGTVFVLDRDNRRVQYFTSGGSFLGKFGSAGSGQGQFDQPYDVAVSPSGNRVYVTDGSGRRIQYFNAANVNVQPASLGKVKALFR